MSTAPRDKPVFHTVGDSNAQFPWHGIPGVCVHWLGPLLCYSAQRVEMPTDLRPGDIVCISLGEIDCRCHVHKHVTRKRPYTAIIDDLVEGLVAHICSWERPPDVTLAVLALPPPARRKRATKNPDYPFEGSDRRRRKYTRYFNQRAAEVCARAGVVLFDVGEHYADRRGFLRPPPFGDGHSHMLDPTPVKRALKEQFGIDTDAMAPATEPRNDAPPG